MTLLDDPPVATPPSTARHHVSPRTAMSAWRFASRLARREVRRRPGRTALTAMLIAIPVTAMTLGSVLARTNAPDWAADFARDFGADTDAVIDPGGFAFASVAPIEEVVGDDEGFTVPTGRNFDDGVLPAGSRVLGRSFVVDTSFTTVDGRQYWGQFSNASFDVTNAAATVGYDIVDGRTPRDGEVLIGAELADYFDVGVGDTLELARPSGSWVVAGIGRIRANYWQEPLVIPDFDVERLDPSQRREIIAVDLPATMGVAEVREFAAANGAITPYDDPYGWWETNQLRTGMAWGYVAGLLALVAVGIIVAAAFATSARRQLVTIGQLSANGAPEGVIRRTLALQGSWTGLVGAVVGIAAGLALLPIATPIVAEHVVMHDIRAYRFSVSDLVIIVITAVVAATLAAAVPARSASRVPVMAALAGRRPAGTPPKWLVPTGLALFLGGLGLIAVAALGATGSGGSENTWAALVVIGATAMVFGTCCAAPLVIERIGRLGRRASLSWRMALRSLARSRTRSAGVVAAIAVAAGGAVAVGTVADLAIRSNACCASYLPADTVMVNAGTYDEVVMGSSDGMVDLGPLTDAEIPGDFLADLDSIVPDATVTPLLRATFDPRPINAEFEGVDRNGPTIATPAFIELVGLSARDRDLLEAEGAIQVVDTNMIRDARNIGYDLGPVEAMYEAEGGPFNVTYPAGSDAAARYGTTLMMTEQAALDAGFDIVQSGLIVQSNAALTDSQLDALDRFRSRTFGTPLDAFVEPGDPARTQASYQSGMIDGMWVSVDYDNPNWRTDTTGELWLARLVVVGAALIVTLGVVAIGLSLAAAEGRDERDTFAVVGATPATMRRQAGVRAAVMALVGIGLGIPLGFIPVWLVDRIASGTAYVGTSPRVVVPWLIIGALLTLVPLLVAAVAWTGSAIATRFRPPTPARRD